MSTKITLKFLSLCFLLCTVNLSIAKAQENDSTVYRVITVDGNEFIGIILSQDTEKIHLSTALFGVLIINKSVIKDMKVIDLVKLRAGKLWYDNPQSTRYFWQPNGYGLKRGEAYYQNVWVFVNQVSFGMSDNFSIGGGVVPLFLIAAGVSPVWVNPKLSIPVVKDKVNLAVGALVGTLLGEGGDHPNFGIVYGISTFGNRDNNFSIGVGYGYAGGEVSRRPVLSISGMLRTGPKGYLLTENYFFSTVVGPEARLLFGGRRMIKSAGIDFGLLMPVSSFGRFIGIPWLGLTIPFGNN